MVYEETFKFEVKDKEQLDNFVKMLDEEQRKRDSEQRRHREEQYSHSKKRRRMYGRL